MQPGSAPPSKKNVIVCISYDTPSTSKSNHLVILQWYREINIASSFLSNVQFEAKPDGGGFDSTFRIPVETGMYDSEARTEKRETGGIYPYKQIFEKSTKTKTSSIGRSKINIDVNLHANRVPLTPSPQAVQSHSNSLINPCMHVVCPKRHSVVKDKTTMKPSSSTKDVSVAKRKLSKRT